MDRYHPQFLELRKTNTKLQSLGFVTIDSMISSFMIIMYQFRAFVIYYLLSWTVQFGEQIDHDKQHKLGGKEEIWRS